MINSWVFKDDESKSEAKTNSRARACLLLVKGPHFACVEHAQCLLLAHRVSVCAQAQREREGERERQMPACLDRQI